jgi:hypothetical protein
MTEYKNLKDKIKTQYKSLFELARNVYKNPKVFEEMSVEENQKNDFLFNQFINDINSCDDYPEELERCIIYNQSSILENENHRKIKLSDKHSTKIMYLARPNQNRPFQVETIEPDFDIKEEACKYLTFVDKDVNNDDVENSFSGFVFILGMYYKENQNSFNPEEPIYGCTFTLNPLDNNKNEMRDIGVSAISCNDSDTDTNINCKTIIFKSFFIC